MLYNRMYCTHSYLLGIAIVFNVSPQSSKCHQHKLRPSGHNKNHKKIPKGLIETNSLDTFKRATQFPFNLFLRTSKLRNGQRHSFRYISIFFIINIFYYVCLIINFLIILLVIYRALNLIRRISYSIFKM